MNDTQQQQQTQQAGDTAVSQLEQLYLSILIQAIRADRLEPVQQTIDEKNGRLWFMSTGTTVPLAMLSYQFAIDSVKFEMQTRDERRFSQVVKYAEGFDGFVVELTRFLQAHRLTANASARARPGSVVRRV